MYIVMISLRYIYITYPSGDFSDTNSTSEIASETLALKEVVSEFAESANITGGLSVDTITTTGNVDIGGVITAPNQISFKATSTISDVINTNISLPFDKITYNVGGGYDNSNYTFTAPRTGTYFFYCTLYTNGNNTYSVDFKRNDDDTIDTTIYRLQRTAIGTGGNTNIPASFTTQLISGDEVIMKLEDGSIQIFIDPFTHWGGIFLG